jgi:hypothetical protein
MGETKKARARSGLSVAGRGRRGQGACARASRHAALLGLEAAIRTSVERLVRRWRPRHKRFGPPRAKSSSTSSCRRCRGNIPAPNLSRVTAEGNGPGQEEALSRCDQRLRQHQHRQPPALLPSPAPTLGPMLPPTLTLAAPAMPRLASWTVLLACLLAPASGFFNLFLSQAEVRKLMGEWSHESSPGGPRKLRVYLADTRPAPPPSRGWNSGPFIGPLRRPP